MFSAPQVWDVETNELVRINFGGEYVYLVKLGSSDVLAAGGRREMLPC